MAEVSTQAVMASGSPYVAGRVKGDYSNKFDKLIETTGNNAKALVKDTFVLGGTATALYGIKKSNAFAKVLSAPLTWVGKGLSKFKEGGLLAGIGKTLQKLPTGVKAAGLILTGAAGLLAIIESKRAHKSGQIEQKYYDQELVDRHQKIHLSYTE